VAGQKRVKTRLQLIVEIVGGVGVVKCESEGCLELEL
jgi:hypothetical protein